LSSKHCPVLLKVGDDFLDSTENFVKIIAWDLLIRSVSDVLPPSPCPSYYSGVNRATSIFEASAVTSLKYATILKSYKKFKLNVLVHIKELIIKRRRLKRQYIERQAPSDKLAFKR
jgi:hypothetical protein